MLREEALDLFRGDDELAPLPEPSGDLLEAQLGMFDVLDQHPEGGLRAPGARGQQRAPTREVFALSSIAPGVKG